jgi:murein DD-endopeptidase MepM/ murein hydrolase activator NlpD
MAAGRVVMVSSLPGYEEIVVIDHGSGQLTLVGRLWQVEVAEGDDVKRGQTIGRVAPKVVDDGLGPSVYAEVRRADVPVDPAPLLRRPKRARQDASVPDPQDLHDPSDAAVDGESDDGETDALEG